MYLDLDLHFSDAVSHAFHSDSRASPTSTASSQVLTFSIHHASPGFFPVSALSTLPTPDTDEFDPFTISLPLRQGASSRTFAQIWKHVERAREVFRPEYVVVQCGVDGLAGDPCGVWNWSTGMEEGEMGWCIRQVLSWGCKVLLLGGGECPYRL
jgi:histone deacetylase 8